MKKERYKSFTFSFKDANASVDREAGVIKGIVIAQFGFDKVGDYMDEVFLNQLVEQGNAQTQGVKSRFSHPNMCKDGMGSFIGRYKDFRFVKQQGDHRAHVAADLYLDPICKNAPGEGNLYDYVLDMAVKNDDMFGNSIAFIPAENELIKVQSEGGLIDVYALRCYSFMASDLVDTPAATDSLFRSSNDFAAVVTKFLDQNPGIFKLVHENPQIIDPFFDQYKSYLSQLEKMKNKKTLLERVKSFVTGEETSETKKSISATSPDGATTINIITDADAPVVGDECQNTDGAPAANGDYNLTNGDTVTVTDGKVSAVTPKAVEEEQRSAEEEEQIVKEFESLKKSNDDLAASNKELKALNQKQATEFATSLKTINDQIKSLTEANEKLAEENKSTNEELTKVKASIKTDYVPKGKKNFNEKENTDDPNRKRSVAELAAENAI